MNLRQELAVVVISTEAQFFISCESRFKTAHTWRERERARRMQISGVYAVAKAHERQHVRCM